MENKIRKKSLSIICYTVITLLFSEFLISSENPCFGTKIKPVTCTSIDKHDVTFPNSTNVTLIALFNINQPSHLEILSSLNFIYVNLVELKRKVAFYAVSTGEQSKFLNFSKKNNIKFSLINDSSGEIFKFYNFTCGECINIIIIDKKNILRYNAAYVDFYFIKEIIDRYEKEEE
jgi:hypothetical protein